jgi:hypothetical protein
MMREEEVIRRARGFAARERAKAESRQRAIWVDGPDSEAARAARSESAQQPDHRAMWEELKAEVDALVENARSKPHLWPEQGAAIGAEVDAFESIFDIMEEAEVAHRSAAEHVARATGPDPTHTPAVRRVVAWVEGIRWAADAFQSDALRAPMGASFEGGPLHGASISNVNDRAARKLRDLADELERNPDIWGQHHGLRHRDEKAGCR